MQKPNQKGAALIIFAVIFALAATAFLVSKLDGNAIKVERDKKTASALIEAKRALIGWSITRNNPGQLPCPEDTTKINLPTEGDAMTSCNILPAVGRLPWRTLKAGDLRDGYGERLWYVISPGFRIPPINAGTLAQLSVNGVPNSAVAIVFSAGLPLSGQVRPIPTSSLPPNLAQYLDLSNNDGDGAFVKLSPTNIFNDQILTVSHDELFSVIVPRILGDIKGDNTQGLVKFYNINSNNYPYADNDGDGVVNLGELIGNPSYEGVSNTDPSNLFFNSAIKNMLVNNGWMSLIDYRVSADRQSVVMTLNSQSITVVP
jgi:hypothetical protein